MTLASRKSWTASVLLLIAGAALWIPSAVRATEDKPAEAKAPALPDCPIMGESIDFNVFTDTDKGRVYFCCPACIKKYTAKPDKYADQVKAQQEALHKLPAVQVSCPFSGDPVDPKAIVEHEGHKIGFCCEKCAAKFQKEPAKYMDKLAGAFTYQTKCPISNHKIDPKVSVKAPGGETVYLCCPKCVDVFQKDPAKFAPALAAQGYGLDLKKK